MNCYIEIIHLDNTCEYLYDIVSFSYERERYTPYTYFTAAAIGNVDPANVASVRFLYDGRLLHHGTADVFELSHERGKPMIRLRSYSFTKQLGQNYSEAGIISNPDLSDIMSRCGVPMIEHQQDTERVNYVYINERTTAWDAICVYAMKAYGSSPYIHSDNTVRCSPPDGNRIIYYNSRNVISYGRGIQLTNMLSDVYVSGISGDTEYSAHNGFAADRHITRRKYMNYDREWVYDLNDQAKFHMNYSNRARQYYSLVYEGYLGEMLFDRGIFTCDDFQLQSRYICAVKVNGSSRGVFTELRFYTDSYCDSEYIEEQA